MSARKFTRVVAAIFDPETGEMEVLGADERLDRLDALAAAATPPEGTRLILAADNLLEKWGTRDIDGRRITAEWGEQRPGGWYEPVFTVHDPPELLDLRRERDELRAAVEAVLKSADPDDDFDGQYIAYIVDAAPVDALRAALHPETTETGS